MVVYRQKVKIHVIVKICTEDINSNTRKRWNVFDYTQTKAVRPEYKTQCNIGLENTHEAHEGYLELFMAFMT